MLAPLWPLVSFFKPFALHFCVLVLLCLYAWNKVQFNCPATILSSWFGAIGLFLLRIQWTKKSTTIYSRSIKLLMVTQPIKDVASLLLSDLSCRPEPRSKVLILVSRPSRRMMVVIHVCLHVDNQRHGMRYLLYGNDVVQVEGVRSQGGIGRILIVQSHHSIGAVAGFCGNWKRCCRTEIKSHSHWLTIRAESVSWVKHSHAK